MLLCVQKNISLVRAQTLRLKLFKVAHIATTIEFVKLLPSG